MPPFFVGKAKADEFVAGHREIIRCTAYLLVSVHADKVAACWVDGNGSGAGVVNWNSAVELQTHRDETVSTVFSATLPHFEAHLSFKLPLVCAGCTHESRSLC